MKKMVFIMPKLGGGGAERVISTIIRYLDKNKFSIHLILVQKDGDYLQKLPEEVGITVLPISKLRYASPFLIREVRKLDPDIIFSTIRGMSIMIGLIKPFIPNKTKIIFREMNSPTESMKYTKKPWFLKLIYKSIYKNADRIVCQSHYMKKDFINKFQYKKDKLVQIYNPVDLNLISEMTQNNVSPFPKDPSIRNVVSIGRLSSQKWYEQLIESLVIAKRKNLAIKVWVLGEGALKNELIDYASELGVKEMIEFVGRKKNPYLWLTHADLFILHSRYEGLPNVLLEAICCGCSPIVTNHPGGTKEIMEIAGLQDRIKSDLVWEEEWFDSIDEKNINSVKNIFDVETIIKEYEYFFDYEISKK